MANKEKLGPVIAFRLPEAKHDEYQAAARAAGVSLSVIIRRCLAESSPQIIVGDGESRRPLSLVEMERMAAAASVLKKIKPPKPSEEKRRLLYLFNKTSNNINQLAYRANSDHQAGIISDNTYTGILAELHTLTYYMKAALKDAD